MKLTAENVDKMFEEAEKEDGDLVGDGLGSKMCFDSTKINKDDLYSMLDELPDSFKEGGGGGMSFLNGCMTKDDHQWGEQVHVARLISMGIACGFVKYCMPKEMWSILPGGVPYFKVLKKI